MHISCSKQFNLLHTEKQLTYQSAPTIRWILYIHWNEPMAEQLTQQSQGQVSYVLLSSLKLPYRFYSVFTMAPFGGREYGGELSITDLLIVFLCIIFLFCIDSNGETCFHNLCVGEQVTFA